MALVDALALARALPASATEQAKAKREKKGCTNADTMLVYYLGGLNMRQALTLLLGIALLTGALAVAVYTVNAYAFTRIAGGF